MKRILYTIQMATELSDEEYARLIEKLNTKETWNGDDIDEIAIPLYLNGYIDGSIEFLAEENIGLKEDIKLA